MKKKVRITQKSVLNMASSNSQINKPRRGRLEEGGITSTKTFVAVTVVALVSLVVVIAIGIL